MKRILFILSVPALIAGFAGCSKSSSSPSTNANVMFVHACASGTASINLAAYDNGLIVSGASNIPFLSNSGYQGLKAGSGITLSFSVTGLGGLDTGVVSTSAGSSYSSFCGGSITQPSFVLINDDLTTPTTGNAKVRFINLSPDNVSVDCFVGATKLDSNLAYKSCSPFYQIVAPASTIKIGMYDHANASNSASISAQTLAAGKIYTFMFTGTASATSGLSMLTLTAITNQ